MCLNTDSKHYRAYYSHVLENKKASGSIAKVYDIISDLTDRRGLKNEWNAIDGGIQDEIIDVWQKIIEG